MVYPVRIDLNHWAFIILACFMYNRLADNINW